MPSLPPLHITLELLAAEHTDPCDRGHVALDDYLGPRDYLIRIGDAFAPATLTWDRALLADLAALRSPGSHPEVLGRLGARLRHFLRDTDWPRHEAELLAALAQHRPVHVTVSANADELYMLPWDLLALDAGGQHLGELPGVHVRYAWPRSRSVTAAARARGGRMLLAWSAAAGQVPAAEHVQALRSACGRRAALFDEDRDVLPRVSWGKLQDALRAATDRGRPVHVLHILCHGVIHDRSVCLAWNDDDGDGPAIIDGGRLRLLLAEHAPALRLVVLCACDSSHEGMLGTHLGSLARTLHRAGIETVIGSAVPLSTRGSITFAERFYRALVAEQRAPAAAFANARRQLARHVRTLDWLALRLYARPQSSDGSDDCGSTIRLPVMQQLPVRQHLGRKAASVAALVIAGIALLALARPGEIHDPLEPPPVGPGKRAPGPHRAEARQFLFELERCQRVASDAVCTLRITNRGPDRKLGIYTTFKDTRSRIYDDANRETRATGASLAEKEDLFGYVYNLLIHAQPASAVIRFPNIAPSARKISRMEIQIGVDKRKPSDRVDLRDIPLDP